VLLLLFPQYKIIFTPNSILFMQNGTSIMVDGENFEYLQAAISDITCMKDGPMDQSSFNPEDAKAKEIAEKLMRGR
jgi:hypothetical protein